MLFACLYTPDFPVQAAFRGVNYDFCKQPAAVLDGPDSLPRVMALNEAARRRSVDLGMTRQQAELCEGILLRKRSPAEEESSQATLLDCGFAFSPRVESTAPGIVIVDVAGTERLLGAPQEIGKDLQKRARECGFVVKVGIAANPDTALHAAVGVKGIAVVPPGEEALHLAPLPVEVLNPSTGLLDVLDSWGIRDCKSFAALPQISLAERLGQEGILLQRLARGEVQRELTHSEAPLCIREHAELEEAIDLLEPLAFVLNRLLEQATARLRTRSLATDTVHVAMELEVHRDRQVQGSPSISVSELYERKLKLPVPTQDSKLLLKLLQLDLAQHPPQSPVKKISLVTEPTRLRQTQTGLFERLAPEPGQLEIALSRLKAVVGESDDKGRPRVGAPELVDSHEADAFAVLPFRSSSNIEVRECLASPRLGLRVFRPPLNARIEIKNDVPTSIWLGGEKAEILAAAGPWRSSGRWWGGSNRWEREEWDVTLAGGNVAGSFRISRDPRSGHWYVEGMYD